MIMNNRESKEQGKTLVIWATPAKQSPLLDFNSALSGWFHISCALMWQVPGWQKTESPAFSFPGFSPPV
jgi:hypothetical protein